MRRAKTHLVEEPEGSKTRLRARMVRAASRRLLRSRLRLDDVDDRGVQQPGDLGGEELGVLAVAGAAGNDANDFASLVDQDVRRHSLGVEGLPQLSLGIG